MIRNNEFLSTNIVKTEFSSTEFSTTLFQDGVCSTDSSIGSLKRYLLLFSPYDVLDIAYDCFYTILDFIDDISVKINMYESGCDKYDYAIAAFSGVVSGLIDSFFVGEPGNSKLGKMTDKVVDDMIVKFAKIVYKADKIASNKDTKRKEPSSIASAIGYLEQRFKVNYDARFPSDLKNGDLLRGFNPSSHHLKSLAHCPDIVGLFFSILDQFTNKTSVVNNGHIYRLESINCRSELRGNNILSKVICGIVNWFGHLISDIGGSSGTRGHENKRGMGIPIPGFELFQFVGKNHENEMKGIAKFTEQMFLKGYDARYGIAMAIPVILNDMITKMFWAFRERYVFNKSWKDIVLSTKTNKRLTRMQIVSSGCFSLVDIGDAAIRSEGNLLLFALHVNYVGLCKFAFAGYREISIRITEVTSEMIDELLEEDWSYCFENTN